MRKIILLQLLVALLLFSCKWENEETLCGGFILEQPTLTNESEYEIINAVIETYYSNADFIHIVQKTQSPVYSKSIKERLNREGIAYDTLLIPDYSEKNISAYFLSGNQFKLNAVRLITPAEISCFFSVEQKGWENYYKKYHTSTGLFTFSRPGINATGNQAVLEYGWQADYLAGMGYLVVLEKINTKWVVKIRIPTWIS